ncbi:MAG TPA: GDCCVxC domain-containing (seleno)protein [Roseiflexaceae bacterium]|nr:GDCCVxC domain-containing (seleno)protein [Roseiflexaceae bacterium]
MVFESTITYPFCGTAAIQVMPANTCVVICTCRGCGQVLRPAPGDCCVFYSYAEPCDGDTREDSYAAPYTVNMAPHCAQNFAPSRSSAWHWPNARGRSAAHRRPSQWLLRVVPAARVL